MITNVKKRINKECLEAGCFYPPFASFRITQLYETGACIYVYFGFNMKGMKDPLNDYIKNSNLTSDRILVLEINELFKSRLAIIIFQAPQDIAKDDDDKEYKMGVFLERLQDTIEQLRSRRYCMYSVTGNFNYFYL